MINYNAANERVKRQYFAYLAEAQGHSEQTIDAVAKAMARFETYTRCKDFKTFHIEQAKAFKRDLADQRSCRSGEPLSKATLYATLTALKRFFVWLAGQPGYKSRIAYSDAEYFNLSAKETRIAKATRPARIPTLEQIRHVIRSMPATTDIERRDRAMIAFTILTARATARLPHSSSDISTSTRARSIRTRARCTRNSRSRS
jgi:site-specific recombinase XerD